MQNKKLVALSNFLSLENDMNEELSMDFNSGVTFAIKSGLPLRDPAEIAQHLASIYDTKAHLEFLRFDEDYFDPLFALSQLKEVLIRLSGYERSILIIDSLKRSSLEGKKRSSHKSNIRYNTCVNFIEDYASLYQNHIQNLEILYL